MIGIGGIGMSALANLCKRKNLCIQGSDEKCSGYVIDSLRASGVHVFTGHESGRIDKDIDVIVVSSAIDKDNPEISDALRLGIPVIHRSDLLKKILSGYNVIAISGTHGKTTTTSLMGHVLDCAGLDPTILSGGIMERYKSNVRVGSSKWAVVEADESDKSLLNFEKISYSIVTNIEPEHMENYDNCFENVKRTCKEFLEKATVASISCNDDPCARSVLESTSQTATGSSISYGIAVGSDVEAKNIVYSKKGTRFDIFFRKSQETWPDIDVGLYGEHNVLNALSVVATAKSIGIEYDCVKLALAQFRGVGRRMTVLGLSDNLLFVDDYAHHPTEVRAVISSLRQKEPENKLLAVFQPHRYSRLKNNLDEFALELSKADDIILLPVYSAGEAEIARVNSFELWKRLRSIGKNSLILEKQTNNVLRLHDAILDITSSSSNQKYTVAFLGAGDVSETGRSVAMSFINRPPLNT